MTAFPPQTSDVRELVGPGGLDEEDDDLDVEELEGVVAAEDGEEDGDEENL